MSTAVGTIPPPISWAQRADLLYVIIDVECVNMEHKVTENNFHFKGVNALDASKKYDVTLNFLHPVDPDQVTSKNIGRCVEYTIYKKESGPYWPSLTNAKTKLHFLKANFTKWQNESDEENDSKAMKCDFNSLVNNGMGMGGMGGMGGMDWNNKFDDFNVEGDDSDDEIPSLSQNDDDGDENDEKDNSTKKEEK